MSHRVPSRSNRAPLTGFSHDNFRYQESVPTQPHTTKHIHHYHHGPMVATHLPTTNRTYRNSYANVDVGALTVDTGLSDDTFTDTATYYEYCDAPHYHQGGFEKTCYSEDSGSTRLPLYESEDGNSICRNNPGYGDSRGSQVRRSQLYRDKSSTSSNTGRDFRRVYPNDENAWGRPYQEINSTNTAQLIQNPQVRGVVSSFPNRPQSSLSSAIGSTVVDGCGGKCQTCENVCYFFLQLVFTMGILIGISLCIAGSVLRKSAARNLQVLVYIGVLVSLVSALLLGIQCNARKNQKNRRKALWTAKRAPIPMDTLNAHSAAAAPIVLQQQPLMVSQESRTQRIAPSVPQISIDMQQHQRTFIVSPDSSIEEQGIPWWRRKDLKK